VGRKAATLFDQVAEAQEVEIHNACRIAHP